METLRLTSGDRRRLISGRRWALGLGVIALSITACGISKPSTPVDGGGPTSGAGGAAGFGGITAGHGGSIGSGGSTQTGAGGQPSSGGQAGAGGTGGATITAGLQYDGTIRFVREAP